LGYLLDKRKGAQIPVRSEDWPEILAIGGHFNDILLKNTIFF
jgi:hypothetical protein